MYLKLILSVFILGITLRLGQTCSCYEKTFKQLYCGSSFVAKFKVKSTLQVEGADDDYGDYYGNYYDYDAVGFYKVRMIGDPWKFPADAEGVDKKRLHTPASDGMCGVGLQQGKTYLISGGVYGDSLHIDYCSSIYTRTPLPRKLRRLKRKPPAC